MTTLTITRGLPGSGKTTWARKQPGIRVNRDDLRAMLLPIWPYGDRDAEDMLTEVQHAAIKTLLSAGHDVIVDDTNLHPANVVAFATLAAALGADFDVAGFLSVPLEVCIERDAGRLVPVGEVVIRRMHAQYLEADGKEVDCD